MYGQRAGNVRADTATGKARERCVCRRIPVFAPWLSPIELTVRVRRGRRTGPADSPATTRRPAGETDRRSGP